MSGYVVTFETNVCVGILSAVTLTVLFVFSDFGDSTVAVLLNVPSLNTLTTTVRNVELSTFNDEIFQTIL